MSPLKPTRRRHKRRAILIFKIQRYIRLLMKHQLAHAPGPIRSWRLDDGLREQLRQIAEADRIWLAENYDLCLESVTVPSLFESCSQAPVEDEPDPLAQTLAQMVGARSSPSSHVAPRHFNPPGMETMQPRLGRFKQGKPKGPR